ncbi:MAG: hypothetical protein J6A16_01055 [Oscillospiraceae bacterium]|nr:hypothetical protein [Oscillospiraceae bacterium]
MAKKRKNTSKQNRPQNNPQGGEKVINQLLGSLEEDNNIESDIADLGHEAEPQVQEEAVPEPVKKRKFFFGFALFVIVMAIVGCISTVRFVVNFTEHLVDNTSLKNEFAQFIFPVVVNDIAPFETVDEIPNTSKITCSIWNILIMKDTAPYEGEITGDLLIPEYDVSVSCKELFGNNASVEHQSVGIGEVRFTYDPDNHVYSASKNIRYLTYAPHIVDITEANGTYTVIVGYLPPSLATVTGISGMEVSPEKYMEYTLDRWDGKNTIKSVRFSDYEPETEEANTNPI